MGTKQSTVICRVTAAPPPLLCGHESRHVISQSGQKSAVRYPRCSLGGAGHREVHDRLADIPVDLQL
ncbi:MAG TPA: hypothetical protein VF940_28150 [Streptosporangiaceae bacterium]